MLHTYCGRGLYTVPKLSRPITRNLEVGRIRKKKYLCLNLSPRSLSFSPEIEKSLEQTYLVMCEVVL